MKLLANGKENKKKKMKKSKRNKCGIKGYIIAINQETNRGDKKYKFGRKKKRQIKKIIMINR